MKCQIKGCAGPARWKFKGKYICNKHLKRHTISERSKYATVI